MSSQKYVTTVSGKKLLIEKTKKFNKSYYEIGDPFIENSGDCYLMDDKKYYRIETNLLVFDNAVKKYIVKNNNKLILFGIINDKCETGYFTIENKNEVVYCILENGNEYHLLSRDVFNNNYSYRERLSDGKFHHISRIRAKEFVKKVVPSSNLKQSLPYDSQGTMHRNIAAYNKSHIKIDKDSDDISKLMKDYTFGLEFETITGFVPTDLCFKNGLIPLRDGSISGLEYVTIPLSGAKGIQTLKNTVNILKDRTSFNDNCALHLHIGNIPRTPEFLLAFMVTTFHIQNEIFELFPLYKKYNFGYKNKNYAAPYPTEMLLSKLDPVITPENITKNFEIIFQFLSEGASFKMYNNDLSQVVAHPNNPGNNQKWNVHTRYFIHNLIPIIFGNKETIEFRIHTPTYDIDKILAFMLLNISIIDFVKNSSNTILKHMNVPPLMNILSIYTEGYPYREELIHYFTIRRERIKNQHRDSKMYENEYSIDCSFKRINPYQTLPKTESYVPPKYYTDAIKGSIGKGKFTVEKVKFEQDIDSLQAVINNKKVVMKSSIEVEKQRSTSSNPTMKEYREYLKKGLENNTLFTGSDDKSTVISSLDYLDSVDNSNNKNTFINQSDGIKIKISQVEGLIEETELKF